MQYQKLSPRQNLAMTWWNRPGFESYDGIICDGSIRSGKTVAMTVGFIMWGMSRFDGQNFAICGKTIESLRRNVTNNLRVWMAGMFTFKEHRSENKITVSAAGKTNTFYLFGGKDESSASLIQGITLAGILLDEVALMPRSFVEQACARCSVAGSKLWFNCNPEGPSHWFYLTWVLEAAKRNMLHLHFTMDDNLSLSPAVKAKLRIKYYGRYMDDFFLICPDKAYLQYCLREIKAYMASLGLELNEKTQIFPLRNGLDFLGFHTYLTEDGKVIRKLRHSSVKRMRAKLRHWAKDYPAGLVTREAILASWRAWDAHAAHGNTWVLRQQVKDRVQDILKEEI